MKFGFVKINVKEEDLDNTISFGQIRLWYRQGYPKMARAAQFINNIIIIDSPPRVLGSA